MARLVDVDNVCSGYFWTSMFEEVITYIQLYLEQYNHPIYFVIHASAIFTKDGEEQELHMSPSQPLHLDPNTPDLRNTIELLYDEIHDAENWGGLNASGYSIVIDTFTYWFKIIPFNPNNTPATSGRCIEQPFEDDNLDDLPEDVDDPRPRCVPAPRVFDSFLLSVAKFFNPDLHNLPRSRQIPLLSDWLERESFTPLSFKADKITPGNVAEWHEQTQRFNIRIFSEFGNVIYARKMENHDDFIDLLWKYRKWYLIIDLWRVLKEKHDRVFCQICRRFHRNEFSCQTRIKVAKNETVFIPEYPEGRHALVIYADFESIVKTSNDHECSGFSFVFIDREGLIINQETRNKVHVNDVPGTFIDLIFKAAWHYAFDEADATNDMAIMGGASLFGEAIRHVAGNLNQIGYKRLRKTHICPICDEEVLPRTSYVTGKNFINGGFGRHHSSCWNDFKNAPVCYFHNFRGYDSHYVLQSLMKKDEIECSFIRGKSFEKFDIISAVKGKIRITFKDTFNYLATSIAKLVAQVENWKYTPEIDRNNKGVFPYKWFDSFDKLYARELPPIPEWFNDVTHTNVDPTPARELWEREQCVYFHQFHDYYMITDVLQLADIFEEFRETCLKTFNLDPVYFQGAPSYSWQLSLKIAADKMHVIPDIDIYKDIQANIKGGIAQVMHRYVNIEDKPDESILFLDVNSLYSKCMTYKLPTKFKGVIHELPEYWQDIYTGDSALTAILCVDLHYPEYLHDLHKAYPLAPHKYNGRLCTTFLDKENYLCHAEALKFYVNEGLVIIKFHYGYVFEQDYILKSYVDNNIVKRRATNSPPLKTLYKLLNNSLYGKTCENKFKYRHFEVKEHEYGMDGKVNAFLSDASNWLEIENKILLETKTKKIILDKPIQIGFAVLDLAKIEMYKFLFEVQRCFKDDVTPLYTDTDSIIMHFKHPHPEEILFNDPDIRPYLDFDKVPSHWKIRTPGTHKQSGLWSLETTERIVEFIGIRAKTYCYRTSTNTVVKNKGVTATARVLESHDKLSMQHYKEALFHNKEIKVTQVTIGSKKHQIKSNKMIKLALSNVDEKRQILPDKITSLPFGYKGEKYAEYAIYNPDLL